MAKKKTNQKSKRQQRREAESGKVSPEFSIELKNGEVSIDLTKITPEHLSDVLYSICMSQQKFGNVLIGTASRILSEAEKQEKSRQEAEKLMEKRDNIEEAKVVDMKPSK